MPDDLVTVRVPRALIEAVRAAKARCDGELAVTRCGEGWSTEYAEACDDLADACIASPPVEASEGDESDEALRAWREDGKAPRGTCPYCGAGISVVERDGWFRARCSHRMCGATGPRMRRLTRAVELFVTRPTRKVYVAVDAASVHPSSLTDVVAMLEDEIERLRAEVARLRGAAEEACERANAAEHEARRQREKAETYGSMAYEANVILGGVGKRDERLLDAAKRVVAERDQAELFLEHVTSGGTIIATAALTPMQIAIARADDRMHVSQRGFGYVHVPGPVGLAPLHQWTEGTIAGCAAATDGIVAWLRSKAETLRDTADEYTCEAHATEARVRASWCDVLADDIASGKHTENPYLKGSK